MLFKKLNTYLARKDEKVPIYTQSAFLKRLSELLREGYTFHEGIFMLLPFHVKNADLVTHKITELQKSGATITETFKLLGFSNRILLPIHLATVHGRLFETISTLAVQTAMYERAQKKLKDLLTYPLFLFVMIFLLFSIFRTYFLPNVKSMISSRGSVSEQSSIGWTNLLLQLPNIFLVCFTFVLLLIGLFLLWNRRRKNQQQLQLWLGIPIVKNWYRMFLTRSFSREMGGLLESGLSLQEAFRAIEMQKEHQILQYIADQMRNKIVHGQSLSEAVGNSDYFLRDLYQYVVHGENSGFVGRELTLYSEFLTERIEGKLSKYLSFLQPVLFLILAVFIIGAYLAILLPIYGMINII